jgi:hypothetical protein
MATNEAWGRAFAKQARADFDAWNALQMYLRLPEDAPALVPRQKLHFLQMACDKLAKAHLLKGGSEVSALEESHANVAKHLPTIVRDQMMRNGENERVAKCVRDQRKRIAREIELLSPAVKDGGRRPDNCEYPREKGGLMFVPAEWPFTIWTSPRRTCLAGLERLYRIPDKRSRRNFQSIRQLYFGGL